MSPMRVAKNELRQRMRDLRARLSLSDVTRMSAAAAANVLALPELARVSCVAMYAPIVESKEIETARIHSGLAKRGARVAYPRVHAGETPLSFHVVATPAELTPSALGIPQPDAQIPAVPLEEIEVFIIPGLAFDHLGERLGWGRGHYDRTLPLVAAALRIGYAYQLQIVPLVPAGADDERVDQVVTESAAHPAPPRRSS